MLHSGQHCYLQCQHSKSRAPFQDLYSLNTYLIFSKLDLTLSVCRGLAASKGLCLVVTVLLSDDSKVDGSICFAAHYEVVTAGQPFSSQSGLS